MTEQAGVYRIGLQRTTGKLLWSELTWDVYRGTPEQIAATYRDIQRHNRRTGWWSVPGPYFTTVVLLRNWHVFRKLQVCQ